MGPCQQHAALPRDEQSLSFQTDAVHNGTTWIPDQWDTSIVSIGTSMELDRIMIWKKTANVMSIQHVHIMLAAADMQMAAALLD